MWSGRGECIVFGLCGRRRCTTADISGIAKVSKDTTGRRHLLLRDALLPKYPKLELQLGSAQIALVNQTDEVGDGYVCGWKEDRINHVLFGGRVSAGITGSTSGRRSIPL